MNKTLRSTNKAIRDMARYFMSSSWGVRNCSCNTCCDRSGNCCWEECSAIDVTFTDRYRCYYGSTFTSPYYNVTELSNYVTRPPLDVKGNPITQFRLYPAPGGSPGSSSSGRTNMMGCEITAGRQHGQYWRTLKKHDFRVWDETPGLPGACPPITKIQSSYLYVYYFSIPAVESGKRWMWAIHPGEEYRPSHGVNPDVPNITRKQLHSTEYRCCGADWDHTGEPTTADESYYRDFEYISIRPVSVTCCKDTNDRSGYDVGGEAGFSQACGLYTEGVAQDDDLWQNSTEYALYDVVRGDDTEQDTWAVSTEYFLNDVVKGDGGDDTFYTCITYHTSTSGDEPPYSTYWKVWVPPPEGQGVTKLKNFYRSRSAHTSTADDEPGVGAAWEAKWSSFHAKNPEFCPCINHSPEFEGGTANINCCASCYEDDCVDLPV